MTLILQKDRSQWEIVFIILAVLLLIGNFCYMVFGRMTVQPWNDDQNDKPAKSVEENKPKTEVLI